MVSKYCLLNEKPRRNYFSIVIILLIILLIFYGYLYKSYDVYKTQAINECEEDVCYLKLVLPYNKVSMINNKTILKIKDEEIEIFNIEYGSYENVNDLVCQDIILTTSLKNNRVYDVRILNNKKRILKRIIDVMKG